MKSRSGTPCRESPAKLQPVTCPGVVKRRAVTSHGRWSRPTHPKRPESGGSQNPKPEVSTL
eukprot:1516838-Rhodomonas_salina.1